MISQPAVSRRELRNAFPGQHTAAGLRIAYVITRSDSIGGAHIHIRDLALALRARAGEPFVIVGGEGPFTEELQQRNIPYRSLRHLVRAINPWHDAAAFFELRTHLRMIRPDLVSTHSAKAGWLGPLAAASLNIPCIQTTHGWSFTTGVPAIAARCYSWIERIGVLSADRVIAVCDYDRQLALRYHVAPANKLTTVHNGMPDLPVEFATNADAAPVQLIMIARFEEQKDHATLLRALAGLRGRSWRLDLIGDGPLRRDIAALGSELQIADRIRFLGARNDVAEQLARSHIFLLISRWEGFPRSILEAMRAGLPVIVSDCGGVREAVTDGVTGFVVAPGDADAIRARLELLLEFPQLRRRLGREGRARYETEFTFDHMFQRTIAIYDELRRRPQPQRASTT